MNWFSNFLEWLRRVDLYMKYEIVVENGEIMHDNVWRVMIAVWTDKHTLISKYERSWPFVLSMCVRNKSETDYKRLNNSEFVFTAKAQQGLVSSLAVSTLVERAKGDFVSRRMSDCL